MIHEYSGMPPTVALSCLAPSLTDSTSGCLPAAARAGDDHQSQKSRKTNPIDARIATPASQSYRFVRGNRFVTDSDSLIHTSVELFAGMYFPRSMLANRNSRAHHNGGFKRVSCCPNRSVEISSTHCGRGAACHSPRPLRGDNLAFAL